MNRRSRRLSSLLLLVSFVLIALSTSATRAAEPSATDAASTADQTAQDGKYLLRYQFSAGDTVRWRVKHLATTETRIQGNTQSSTSQSESTKCWRVESIDDKGKITISHSVEHVDMWQKLSDRPEVRYNSSKDDVVPREYEAVARTIGVPLTTVTISSDGKMHERKSASGQPNLGLGDMVMLLPPKPVQVGSDWYEPAEIQIRLADERVKRIKIRKFYKLKKVQTGVATIEVKTEVLTPIQSPSVKAQLIQQIVNGTIKFDIDAGRVMAQQMDWDETVVGFNGSESMMKYLARFTEELLPETTKTASREKSLE